MTSPEEMLVWLDGRIASTEAWLHGHGPGTKRPWPATDIEAKENNLSKYQEIRGAYLQALKRRSAAA